MNAHARKSTRTKIISLLSDPLNRLTHEQIAEVCGVSRSTVSRVVREVRGDLDDVQEKLQEYQRHINELMPIEARVRRYRELVEQNEQQMVALKALERLDALDGIVTRTEDKHLPKEEPEKRHKPMFVLPDGTSVNLRVDSCHPADGAIDVTPAKQGDD